jgi:2-C-methyl-D-erythritol 2,4-cyclodiphosphate synthase
VIRVGIGYDIHRVDSSRRLVLGGVEIPAGFGLFGHSDADVVLHAIMDALLGAASLADIGHHFPPSDDAYRDASSLDLLQRVRLLLLDAEYRPVNVDVTIVAEKPRLVPYVPTMRERIAEALHLDTTAVGVKATTNEGVGPEGRVEAISAQAVALIESV